MDKDHAFAVMLDALVDVAFNEGSEIDGGDAITLFERAGLVRERPATAEDVSRTEGQGCDCEVGDMIYALTDEARVMLRAARAILREPRAAEPI